MTAETPQPTPLVKKVINWSLVFAVVAVGIIAMAAEVKKSLDNIFGQTAKSLEAPVDSAK